MGNGVRKAHVYDTQTHGEIRSRVAMFVARMNLASSRPALQYTLVSSTKKILPAEVPVKSKSTYLWMKPT